MCVLHVHMTCELGRTRKLVLLQDWGNLGGTLAGSCSHHEAHHQASASDSGGGGGDSPVSSAVREVRRRQGSTK